MSLTPEQRAELLKQGAELERWLADYRAKIDGLIATAEAKSKTLQSIRWALFKDRYPNFN